MSPKRRVAKSSAVFSGQPTRYGFFLIAFLVRIIGLITHSKLGATEPTVIHQEPPAIVRVALPVFGSASSVELCLIMMFVLGAVLLAGECAKMMFQGEPILPTITQVVPPGEY
jgi:hypothetical protein